MVSSERQAILLAVLGQLLARLARTSREAGQALTFTLHPCHLHR